MFEMIEQIFMTDAEAEHPTSGDYHTVNAIYRPIQHRRENEFIYEFIGIDISHLIPPITLNILRS